MKIFLHFRPHYCINTAVVYMHRFYMINSFKRFIRQVSCVFPSAIRCNLLVSFKQRVCAAALFLACKVEEFPRTLRDVIENTGKVLRRKKPEEFTKEVRYCVILLGRKNYSHYFHLDY